MQAVRSQSLTGIREFKMIDDIVTVHTFCSDGVYACTQSRDGVYACSNGVYSLRKLILVLVTLPCLIGTQWFQASYSSQLKTLSSGQPYSETVMLHLRSEPAYVSQTVCHLCGHV